MEDARSDAVPAGEPPADAPPDDAGPIDPADIAATMMGQFTDLLGQWERQVLDLAERGIDPRPLLRALTGTLRNVADQLDEASADSGATGVFPDA